MAFNAKWLSDFIQVQQKSLHFFTSDFSQWYIPISYYECECWLALFMFLQRKQKVWADCSDALPSVMLCQQIGLDSYEKQK